MAIGNSRKIDSTHKEMRKRHVGAIEEYAKPLVFTENPISSMVFREIFLQERWLFILYRKG